MVPPVFPFLPRPGPAIFNCPRVPLDLELPMRGLYLLAAPSTPEEARQAVRLAQPPRATR